MLFPPTSGLPAARLNACSSRVRSEERRSTGTTSSRNVIVISPRDCRTLLQLLQGPRPVLFEKARHRSVGEKATVRLTSRAIIGLVVRVANALNRRPTDRTRLFETPMHRHALAKRSHLLWERLTR